MPALEEHKTVQARILEFAEAICCCQHLGTIIIDPSRISTNIVGAF